VIPSAATVDDPFVRITSSWSLRGRRALAAALGLAVAVDVTMHAAIDGRAGTMLSTAAAVAMLAGARVRRPAVIVLALLASAFGVWLSVRESPWLLTLDLVAIVLLLLLAAGCNHGGDPRDFTFVDLARRGIHALLTVALSPLHLFAALVAARPAPADAGRRRRYLAVARGAALALPLVATAGVLLASADGVFASFLRLPVRVEGVGMHLAALAIGLTAGIALIAHAHDAPPSPIERRRPLFGTVEVAIVLGGLVALYGLFALAQAVALTRGADYVARATGLTYAEYARRGYFQLLAVAALTVLVLLAVRPYMRMASPAGRRALVVLAETAIALTLLIIAAAIHRLDVYDDVFGLTMLRLACIVFACWLAVVFLLVAVAYLRATERQWLAPAVASSALVTLFVWNAVNPEAVVARHNVAEAASTARFDPAYLASLSDDAVPTLVASLPRLSPANRLALTRALCSRHGDADRGFWGANRSAGAARRALRTVC
jgi:hypothetical protein